jgi:outer membrane receptor protein involved in Fe transport
MNQRNSMQLTVFVFLLIGLNVFSPFVPAAKAQSTDSYESIEEVTVTATRREASLQDIPLSVTALTGDMLEELGADNVQNYYRQVPNLAVVDRGPGSRMYIIRGISTGIVQQGAATVGVYIDEMPVTANDFQPDLVLFDIDRVEVLRGPQGTLFGEGSLGGTVRMITKDPDMQAFDALGDADISSTEDGGTNWKFDGMLNVPVAETAAFRVSAYSRNMSGYIDRIEQPEGVQLDFGALIGLPPGSIPPVLDTGPIPYRSDINDEETYGGRAAFLWTPNDALAVELSYMMQNSNYGGRNTQTYPLDDLETNFFLPETVEDDFDLTNLTVTYEFPAVTLLSSTSFFNRDNTIQSDNADLGELVFPGLKLAGTGQLTNWFQDQFSQEIRFVSSTDYAFDWTAGLFYLNKNNGVHQVIVDEEEFFVTFANFLVAPFVITSPLQLLDITGTFDEKQFAAYGDLTYRFTDTWSATFGLRYFDYEQTNTDHNNNINILGLGLPDATFKNDENGTNLKFGLNYQATEQVLIYVSASEGFRIGGTNNAPGIPEESRTYASDSLWNYELGLKTTLADGHLQINTAAYYVDWTDIQLALPLGFSFATVNAGKAHVAGAEIELVAKPVENLEISLALGVNDGELSEDAPGADNPGNPNPGYEGDRLPGAPDLNGAFNVLYNAPIGANGLRGFGVLEYTYTGDSTTTFNEQSFVGTGASSYFELDSYGLLNLRAGLESGHWITTLYVENVTDERAELLRDNVAVAERITRNRPRTFGLKVQYFY